MDKRGLNGIATQFKQGNRSQRAKPIQVIKGIKPGIYPSIQQAAKANRTYASYLKAIADGKFKSLSFEVKYIES